MPKLCNDYQNEIELLKIDFYNNKKKYICFFKTENDGK